jgi:phage terminase large subunit
VIEYLPKQKIALEALSVNSPYTEILFGGGASGGKSFLLQDWQIQRRLKYFGSRGFIARNDLGDLRKYTIPEVYEKLNNLGLKIGRDYSYDGRDMCIKFFNQSVLYFIDLFAYPSDPLFARYGSSAFTDGAIEEAAEITEMGKNIIKSRIRFRLTHYCNHCATTDLHLGEITKSSEEGKPLEWKCKSCGKNSRGLDPKLFMTCNPDSGYLRSEFYSPWESGTLDDKKIFIPSLASDNDHTPQSYIDTLNALPEMDRKRLLYGDWYYDNATDAMFQYKDLLGCFSDVAGTGDFYISADVARLGKDRTVIGVWHGLTLVDIVELNQQRTPVVEQSIRELISKYGVKIKNVIIDEDGIGGGVSDHLPGSVGFTNGGTPFNTKLFTKNKDECFFKLAEYIEMNKIAFRAGPKETIIKELQAVRREKPEGDTKLRVISKDKMKLLLAGKSPDYADMIMMRMNYELRPATGKYSVSSIS